MRHAGTASPFRVHFSERQQRMEAGSTVQRPRIGIAGVEALARNTRASSVRSPICATFGASTTWTQPRAVKADRYNTSAVDRFEELLADVDAVVLAVPTSAHYEMAYAAIEQGKHILLESRLPQQRRRKGPVERARVKESCCRSATLSDSTRRRRAASDPCGQADCCA